MVSVNQTRPHCVNQMGKTHYKPLAVWAQHGRGTAWAGHVMCELAFTVRRKPGSLASQPRLTLRFIHFCRFIFAHL